MEDMGNYGYTLFRTIPRIQTVWYAPTTQQLVLLLILKLTSKTQPTYPHETRRGRTPTRNLPKRHHPSHVQSAQTASTVHAQSIQTKP